MGEKTSVIKIESISKSFRLGDGSVRIIRDLSLDIHAGDFAVIFGPSGCGKSTLLNMILGIDTPTTGRVCIRDTDLVNLDEDERATFRSRKMGMVHQMPYWVKSVDVRSNVALPLIIKGEKQNKALAKADQMLKNIGMTKVGKKMPAQLSGGEQQKVSIARALICEPWILLADEPTGNLDSQAAGEIMDLFSTLNQDEGRTILLVTHNENYWNAGNRRIEMKDGMIIHDTKRGGKNG